MKTNPNSPAIARSAAILLALIALAAPEGHAVGLPLSTTGRPDVLYRDKERSGVFHGNDIYTRGARQKIVQKTTGDVVRIEFDAQNDDTFIGMTMFQLRATRGDKYFKTKYFDTQGARKNITAEVIRGKYRYVITSGSDYIILQEVKPARNLKNRKMTRTYKFTARDITSNNFDTAKAIIKKLRR